MKLLLLVISVLFLQGCSKVINETVETVGVAVSSVKKADAIQSVGNATEKLADAQIKKQEIKQLIIKENSDALNTAVQLINQVDDEDKKLEIGTKLLNARTERLADEQRTTRTKYRTNAWFWGAMGVLLGFSLAVGLSMLTKMFSNIEGNLYLNKKK